MALRLGLHSKITRSALVSKGEQYNLRLRPCRQEDIVQAIDIMTPNVVCVDPDANVRDIAQLLLENRISAVPVVDDERRVLGIVSEGDLMRRVKDETDDNHSWWLSLFSGGKDPGTYIKSHGRKAHEVMTPTH